MKQLIGSDIGKYLFDPIAKSITFVDIPEISLANILVITDVSAGIMLYNFADPNLGGRLEGLTLFLEYDTSLLNATDFLQVWIDLPAIKDDCCDVSEDNQDTLDQIPLAVLPGNPGQQTSNLSFPVALAREQFFDTVLNNVIPIGATWTGKNGLSPDGLWLDCLQYRSISFEIVAASGTTVTLAFEGSNDGINAVAMQLFDSAAPATAPVTSVAVVASTVRFFEGPLKYRYFRARVSTAVAGSPVPIFTRLSLQPWIGTYAQVAASNLSSNIAQYGGNNVVTAGVNGVPAVGGNIAVGASPTVNPITVGGTDSSSRTRRFLTDTFGSMVVVGVDPRAGINKDPILTRMEEGHGSGYGVQDLLYLILQELKTLRYLPERLNSGLVSDRDVEAIVADTKQQ